MSCPGEKVGISSACPWRYHFLESPRSLSSSVSFHVDRDARSANCYASVTGDADVNRSYLLFEGRGRVEFMGSKESLSQLPHVHGRTLFP